MKMTLLILWYVFVLLVAALSIPFSLSCFAVWQLLSIWPYVLSFIGAVGITLIGFCMPNIWLKETGEGSREKKL